MANNMNFNEVV